MGVGQDNPEDLAGDAFGEGGIGQDEIHPRGGLVAEGHAHIHDDPLSVVGRAVAIEVEVHADLVRAPEGQKDELVVWERGHAGSELMS